MVGVGPRLSGLPEGDGATGRPVALALVDPVAAAGPVRPEVSK